MQIAENKKQESLSEAGKNKVFNVTLKYLELNCNTSQTAKALKMDWHTVSKMLNTQESENIMKAIKQEQMDRFIGYRDKFIQILLKHFEEAPPAVALQWAGTLNVIFGFPSEIRKVINITEGDNTTITNHLEKPLTPEQLQKYNDIINHPN